MIREVNEKDVPECVKAIRDSFATVADEFGFTIANAPRFTAFATTEDRLKYHLLEEHRPMYAFYDKKDIVGYYSLFVQDDKECELNNLSVIPAYRHRGIGEELLKHAFKIAKELNCNKINISIVEENKVLRKWYESFGFVHAGTRPNDSYHLHVGIWKRICNIPVHRTDEIQKTI